MEQNSYGWMSRQLAEQSPIMITPITLQRLLKRGYEPLLAYYEKISPQLNEPMYTRPVRTVVGEVHLIGKLSVRLPTRCVLWLCKQHNCDKDGSRSSNKDIQVFLLNHYYDALPVMARC